MTLPFLARNCFTLAFFALLTLTGGPARALDCWVPTIDQTQAAYAKLPLSGMREAVLTAEQVVRDNPHFKAMPRPIRIRSQIAVGPGFGQLNVKAYRPDVWEGTCGLVHGADRCCSDGGINMMFNDALSFLSPYAKDDMLEIFYEPRRSGTVGGFPEYDGMNVLLSAGGRLPWVPVTVAEFLDFFERQRQAQAVEFERNRPAAVQGLDMAQIEAAYEGMKKFDPKAAEEFRANMLASMPALAENARKQDARVDQLYAEQLAEVRQLRVSLTPAQLAAQAYHGNGPLNLGRADDPLSQPLVKLDPGFPDRSDPNRVQLIRVFVSVVDADTVAERLETLRQTKATLDYARLTRLLQ